MTEAVRVAPVRNIGFVADEQPRRIHALDTSTGSTTLCRQPIVPLSDGEYPQWELCRVCELLTEP
jgi:hypothetical protein